ncbi:Rha family transcriptional regulator [Lactobacillus panisapium]|uniref:Rha family transcriptional regulator n=1 Tax=Lactobacillus panisapium TaxID=2012495 RepID=UPI001C69BBC5|nr:phage regulatory protein/antirepressor Ant [Lactobacillus panisapium]
MQNIQLLNFDGQEVIDSRDVATMVGKSHAHLNRDIAGYKRDISTNPKLDPLTFFIDSTYKDKKGEIRKNYLITKQGCEFVANKMTGKKGNQFTAEYVNLFNRMKQQVTNPMELIYQQWDIPRTYGGALQLAANQAELLEKQKPKVEYYDSQMRNPGLMTTTEIAKDYGWSATRLNQELRRRRVIYPQGSGRHKVWVLYRDFAGRGYTQYEAFTYEKGNTTGMHNNLKWTQKGKKFIYDLLAEDGIRPTLERMDLLEG